VELRRIPLAAPGPGELLVRIGAATTCGTDVKVLRRGGHPRMLHAPTPFGHEMAGTVVALGTPEIGRQELWQVGDRVVVANSAPCGQCEPCLRGRENLCRDLRYLNGAFAEYILVPARFAAVSTYALPDDLPFEIASLAEPLACVLHGLELCPLERPSDTVVYGGGPIGLLFVNLLAGRITTFSASFRIMLRSASSSSSRGRSAERSSPAWTAPLARRSRARWKVAGRWW
jgi:L-iditol 2-dehydrogenase